MMVIVLSKCPASLKGDLSKWLFEVATGVYIGNPSKRVRENLMLRIKEKLKAGRAVMVCSERSEQGLSFEVVGSKWIPVDFDGIELMFHPDKSKIDFELEAEPVHREPAPNKCSKKPYPSDYVVIDLETTGLDPEQSEITEIAAVKVRQGKVVDGFDRLIKISGEIPKEVEEMTGLSKPLLTSIGSPVEDSLSALKEFTGDLPIVGHNISFDLSFLNKAHPKDGKSLFCQTAFDTVKLARSKLKHLESYKLDSLLKYFQCPSRQTHVAIEDCLLTQKVFEKLKSIA